MPYFHAPFHRRDPLWGNLFLLDVFPPAGRGPVNYTLPMLIVCDYQDGDVSSVPRSLISASLAAEYGLDENRQVEIAISQASHISLRIHEFDPFPLPVKIAPDRCGENFLLIGWDDLTKFFVVEYCSDMENRDMPDFLFLTPRSHYKHWCREKTSTSRTV